MRNQSSIILSGATDVSITGTALQAAQIINVTMQPIVTGGTTTAGTLKVQGSNDLPPSGITQANFTPTNWADIPSATSTIAAGVGSMIVLSNVACQFLRVVFTQTGGDAGETLTVKANSVGA